MFLKQHRDGSLRFSGRDVEQLRRIALPKCGVYDDDNLCVLVIHSQSSFPFVSHTFVYTDDF